MSSPYFVPYSLASPVTDSLPRRISRRESMYYFFLNVTDVCPTTCIQTVCQVGNSSVALPAIRIETLGNAMPIQPEACINSQRRRLITSRGAPQEFVRARHNSILWNSGAAISERGGAVWSSQSLYCRYRSRPRGNIKRA